MLHEVLLPKGVEMREIQPSIGFIPGLNLWYYLAEDSTAVTVPVIRGRYHDWDLLLHGEHRHAIGFQFWSPYNPQRLLPAPG